LGKLAVLDLEAFLQDVDIVIENFDAALRDRDLVKKVALPNPT
jgi:hypothetical protein